MNDNNITKIQNVHNTNRKDLVMTVNYYIGTKDKDTKDYKLTDEFIKQTIIDEVTKQYPNGFTITEGIGYYKHNNREIVTEKTYIVTVLDEVFVNRDLTDALKDKLNQECIGVQVINDNTMFM